MYLYMEYKYKYQKYKNKYLKNKMTGGVYTTIKGPISMIYYDIPEINKKILLFGDIHTKFGECIKEEENVSLTVIDFINNIIHNSPNCIDLFVEDRYKMNIIDDFPVKLRSDIDVNIGYAKNTLLDVRRYYEINSESYPSLRHHYWDVRQFDSIGPSSIVAYKSIVLLLLTDTEYTDKLLSVHNSSPFYLFLYLCGFNNVKDRPDINLVKMFQNNIENILENDLENVANMKMTEFMRNKIFKQIQNSYLNTEFLLQYFHNIGYEKFGILRNLSSDFSYISVAITDIYLLCRMFRTFDTTDADKLNRGNTNCRIDNNEKNRSLENIIIYGGNEHIKNINGFIQYYYNAYPSYETRNENNDDKCINVNLSVNLFNISPFSILNILEKPFKYYDKTIPLHPPPRWDVINPVIAKEGDAIPQYLR
jgi:hypothetical protein